MSEPSEDLITKEWLEANGFARDPVGLFGYSRLLSEGPGDSELRVNFGTYPFNDLCISIIVGGFGVVTNCANLADLKELIRLLDGGAIDHPHEAWFDGDEEDDDDE